MSDERPRSKKRKKRRPDGAEAVATATPVPEPQREQEVKPVTMRPALRPGWTVPHPEELPKPTFWPASLAFAVTFLLWGIVTSPIITAVGGILLVVSLAGWIGDIAHESGH